MAVKNNLHETISKFRMDIMEGKLIYGSILPPEVELAESLKVSRPTIAKIYNSLQDEGLVKKKPGLGTTVIFSREKKKYTFGLLLPGSGESEIFGPINDHILNLSKIKDFTCLWDGTIANDADMRQSMIFKNCQRYIDYNVDGVIFSPLERTSRANGLNDKICKLLDSKNILIVLLDRDITPFPYSSKYDVICLDNFRGGFVMTDHLIKQGCNKVYFIHRKDSAYSVNLRLSGFKSACNIHNLEFNNENVFCGDASDLNFVRKIKIYNKRTGILCANDSTAAELMSSLTKLGYKTSRDFLIAGFDDMKYAKHLQVPLTTYKQPLMDIVKYSYEIMHGRIADPVRTPVTLNLEGKLIVRESTKFL